MPRTPQQRLSRLTGTDVQALRARFGWTAEELASLVAQSTQTIKNLEYGTVTRQQHPQRPVERLMKVLGYAEGRRILAEIVAEEEALARPEKQARLVAETATVNE